MIPKKIHYCWFGKNPLPNEVKKCIESWKLFCPDYEIIEWNEENYDVFKIDYMAEAYKAKKYAFVSDYARLDIIYNNGGIYLDTDVELIRPLDDLLHHSCYLGMELPGRVATGLGFGAVKGNNFLYENMKYYEHNHFFYKGRMNLTTCVEITTNILKKHGLSNDDNIQIIKDTIIFSTEYFCPYDIEKGITNLTCNTISIHHYSASWYQGGNIIKNIRKKTIPIKIKIRKRIDSSFGIGSYEKIKKILKGF
ncbi:glycosyl transferase [Enterococcus hirae]|uniref:glycosyltransferase family 32 protein n=1 Tax=Enterococcus TaxID=1350 RepID=UPI002DBDD1E9|nr:glycosyltransferase [Enterococcus hirae]MEB7407569.1 glycosyl transferase [Enterococcus hirae]